MVPRLRVRLLGDFCLLYDETPVSGINTARLQSLLAYFVLHREAPQFRHHLAFLFWPDSNEGQALTNLRHLLHQLRRILPEADRFLHINAQALQWRPDAPFSFDVGEFESAVAEARRAEQAGDQTALRMASERAVALYQGDLLPGCYDDWVVPERERLHQTLLDVLQRLILLLENQRDYPAAIAYAQRLLQHEPVHEATYRCLMRLYALSGDRAAALHTYHVCETALQRELSVQPSRATREAYEHLLRTEALPVLSPTFEAGRPAVSPLIGRDREWARLQGAWQAAAAPGGKPCLVVLTGETGIGKTRLAEELLIWADRQGISTASAHCYSAEGELPYAPVVTWLRARPQGRLDDVWLAEVARLTPEVQVQRPDLPVPAPLTETWQRQRLFEALARATLANRQSLLLMLDDIQWCDRDSIEWLHYLLRFDPQMALLIVCTLRAEEREGHSPLTKLLEALHRSDQLVEIELGPLTAAETLALAAQLAGKELDPAHGAPLYQASEGNPFFVVQMVRAGLSIGKAWSAGNGKESTPTPLPLPPKVRLAIETRLTQLSPSARELAGLAATIGREFTFATLAQASDADPDALVRDLDELWRRRIVREQGAEVYDFSHDLLREVAYAGLSAAQRRRLHSRVAQALETVYAQDLDAVCAQVAAHHEQAGLAERAIPYYQRAAEAARRLYANREAAGYYRRALALIEAAPSGRAGRESHRGLSAQLYEGLGDVLALTAQHDAALAAYRDALSQASEGHSIAQARLLHKSGKIWETQHQYEGVARAYDRAEAALDGDAADAGPAWWREWAEIQVDRIWLHYWQGHLQAMAELIGKVRPAIEQHGAPAQRFRFAHATYLIALTRDRFLASDEALGYAREALAASRASGDLSQMAWGHLALGFGLLWRAELEEAEEALQTALDLAESSGDVVLQSRCLAYLSVLYRRCGRVEQARHYSARGLDTATTAQMPEYAAIAHANLAWMAWRARNLPEAMDQGHAALALWRSLPMPFAFCWTALWPLIGAALALGQRAEAIDYARELLKPAQMRLPDPLAEPLGRAIRAWEEEGADAARTYLDHALDLALEMGYL